MSNFFALEVESTLSQLGKVRAHILYHPYRNGTFCDLPREAFVEVLKVMSLDNKKELKLKKVSKKDLEKLLSTAKELLRDAI